MKRLIATERRTALAAAVLALLGGLVYLTGLCLDAVALLSFPDDAGRVGLHAAVDLVLVSALLPGGVLLLRREPLGRIGCIAGSCAAMLATLTSTLLAAAGVTFTDFGPSGLAVGGLGALALVVPPAVVTLALAASGPAARWCGAEIHPT
ncbi:hypothetical protein M8542_30450 [Amycolatopsis sp. OK19-0408]|uniref:Uncharacterized protein n=1 Tax=Amycolatopsis iheyensis TaxID=2945988 RepID=A0A9X2NH43_9PSEU|nr:hypothetical protein [Amycolatopsis iheyensis]MCR6487158.1 hypothetical protein [Amycolatopsis iheyensis]